MFVEVQLGENCFVSGDFVWEDESFDHAFGREKQDGYELKNFAVVVLIEGMDYDITKGLRDRDRDYFEERLRERFYQILAA